MIYDAFLFYNELDLLEIRLNELKDVVDRFVLLESSRTFTNKPKPLVFKENRSRFSAFLDRIIHIEINRFDTIDMSNTWKVEYHMRRCLALDFDTANRTISFCCRMSMSCHARKWSHARRRREILQPLYIELVIITSTVSEARSPARRCSRIVV